MNIDGTARKNPGTAEGGGIIRDARGYLLTAFMEHYGSCTSVRSELKALHRGLIVAKQEGFRKLLINVDSEVVVSLMMHEVPTEAHSIT